MNQNSFFINNDLKLFDSTYIKYSIIVLKTAFLKYVFFSNSDKCPESDVVKDPKVLQRSPSVIDRLLQT